MDRNSIGDLLRALCERGDAGSLADTLGGVATDSPRGDDFVRVSPTRFEGVTAIDVRPWTGAHFGLATPELSTPSAWTRADVERTIGPLQRVPANPGGPPFTVRYSAAVDDPRLPALAVAYVTFADGAGEGPDAVVTGLEARVESMEKYR